MLIEAYSGPDLHSVLATVNKTHKVPCSYHAYVLILCSVLGTSYMGQREKVMGVCSSRRREVAAIQQGEWSDSQGDNGSCTGGWCNSQGDKQTMK